MSPRYLAVVVLIVAGIAMFNKVSPWLAAYVPASLILAQAITTVLKYTINRPRPPVQEQLVYTYDPSFPSGAFLSRVRHCHRSNRLVSH